MFKNVAGQKIALFAFDTTTNVAKSGDAANLTAYASKDHGAVTVLGDVTATEMDATNAKGWYLFDLTQGETDADTLLYTAKSTTANISIVGRPIFTDPSNYTAFSVNSIESRIPAALVGGRMDSSVGAAPVTFAEPTTVPAFSSATLIEAIAFIIAAVRNKTTQTATTMLLRNNADAATIATSTISDDGVTFIRGKLT